MFTINTKKYKLKQERHFKKRDYQGFTKVKQSLAGWFTWLEHCPAHRDAEGLIPGQGTDRWQPVDVSLSRRCFSCSPFSFL